MAVSVRIPAPLRKFTAGKPSVEIDGTTVKQVLVNLTERHSEIRTTLFDGSGTLRSYVNVFVGEQNIRDLQGLDTPVDGTKEVSIVPAIAGGRA